MKQTLVISCPASSRSGYGDHARDIIRSFVKTEKYNVKVMDQRWGNCPRTELNNNPDIAKLVLPSGPLQSQPEIWVQVTVPNEFTPVGSRFNIGITAGIETDMVAPEWIDGMNRMDLNIVPSHHSKMVFERIEYDRKDKAGNIVDKLKLQKPIHVLFEGLDLDVYDKTDDIPATIVSSIEEIPESFCFLSVGHWLQGDFGHDRKDVGSLIHTFCLSFKGKKVKPALILKTSGATFSVIDREDMLRKIRAVKRHVGLDNLPNIYLIHGDLTEKEINGLYNHPKVKALVSFTHGEGFGSPLLEFGTTGKPIIAPNWSGQTDFLGNYTFKLPGELKEVHKSTVQKGIIVPESKWFYVDYGYASKLMKDIYKKYKTFLATSRKQRKYVKDNFSLQEMDSELLRIINDSIPEPVKLTLPKLKAPKLGFPKLEKVND